MSDISLNSSVEDIVKIIEKDISDISELLENVYSATLTLNETKWNTKEKKKIDEELLPYLQKISMKYPSYLSKRLYIVKEAIEKYNEVDNIQKKSAQQL